MMEALNFFPCHIIELLQGLSLTPLADPVLLSYHSCILFDPILYKIYQILDFPNQPNIPSKRLERLIEREYTREFPRIDEFTVKESEIFIDSRTDMPSDLVKEDLFETKSVSSMQSEETNSTPLKYSPRSIKRTRSRNGLKTLSCKVKEIVERLGSSTYQEVADCLVREEIDLKAEKNIRRRVYDALNVLIAVGVLKKFSKTVEPIKMVRVNTQEKVRNLRKTVDKYLRIQAIINRNKGMKQGHQSLYLPFNVVGIPSNQEKAKIEMALHRFNTVIKVDREFVLKNSDEVLSNMELDFDFGLIPVEVLAICKFTNNMDPLI